MISLFLDWTNRMETAAVNMLRNIEPPVSEIFGDDIVPIAQKVNAFVIQCFLTFCSALLFLSVNSMFFAGLVFALINPNMMEDWIIKIVEFWNKQLFSVQCFLTLAGVLAWPMSTACAAFFVGGYTCLSFQGRKVQVPRPAEVI
jgi:hypothetical protein